MSAKQAGLNIGVLSALIQAGLLDSFVSKNRCRLVLEAQTFNILTDREKRNFIALGEAYDYDILNSKFQHSKNIFIHNKAISNKKSITKFYDTNIEGSQSILEPGKFAKEKYNISSHAEIDVETEKLDNIFSDEIIDCLWIDVQGAEGLVIEGAINLLERTKAIFVEVSIREGLYNKGIIMSDIVSIAREVDFELVGLGIDYDNFTGNDFLVKKII